MELRHLLYFKTVAEELHFGHAASKLFMSQPPLSRQIKDLEIELGVRLFERNNKRVLLTDAGKYFKTEVDEILSKLDESKHVVRQIYLGESGALKIGYISSVYQPHLAEVLKEMRKAFPYHKTSLYEVPTVTQIEALEQGKLDVGILRAPIHSCELEVKTLFFDPFLLVAPAVHSSTKEIPLIEMLKVSPFIFFNKDFAPSYHDKLMEICERMGFRPEIAHEANNVHSILQLVEAGLGVSILPHSLQKQYAHLKVSFIEIKDIPVSTEVVLAYKRSNRNPVLRWFIDQYANH